APPPRRAANRNVSHSRRRARSSAAVAGSVENANTGSAPSARADTPTMTPIDRNTTVTRRRVGRPCTRATPGSKLANVSPRNHHRWIASPSVPTAATAWRSNGRTTTALPKMMFWISFCSWVTRDASRTAAPPHTANTNPSRLSRVRRRRAGSAVNSSVARSDAAAAPRMGSNDAPSLRPAKNDAATPRPAAWVMAALTNTMRRATTYTDRNPSATPAPSAHRIGSRNSSIAPQNASHLGRSPPMVPLHRAVVAHELGVGEHRLRVALDHGLVLAIEEQDLIGVLGAQLDVVGDDDHRQPALARQAHQPL